MQLFHLLLATAFLFSSFQSFAIAKKVEEKPRDLATNVMPAGLYFRDGYLARWVSEKHDAKTVSDLPAAKIPKFVVSAGLHKTTEAASEQVRSLSNAKLVVGYPWAVHTKEIGLVDASLDGILIVTGLFREKSDAETFVKHIGKEWLVLELATADEVAKRDDKAQQECSKRNDTLAEPVSCFPGSPVTVLEIDGTKPVSAYSKADVDKDLPGSEKRVTPTKPVCSVAPGQMFLIETSVLYNKQRAYAPVYCGDKIAYVPWTQTRLETIVVPAEKDKYLLHQVTLVVCDQPGFGNWYYDEQRNRTPVAADVAKLLAKVDSGCGK